MKVFTLFILVILLFGLARDFNQDKGQHKRAKSFHAVLLVLICLNYAGSFGVLGSVVRHFDRVRETFGVSVGVVPGGVHLTIYLVHLTLSLIVLILAYQMINRKDKSRRLFLIFLPFLALTEVFSFYRGWVSGGDDAVLNHGVIILIGLLFFGIITTSIIAIYSSNFMKEFFQFDSMITTDDGIEPIQSDIENTNKV